MAVVVMVAAVMEGGSTGVAMEAVVKAAAAVEVEVMAMVMMGVTMEEVTVVVMEVATVASLAVAVRAVEMGEEVMVLGLVGVIFSWSLW